MAPARTSPPARRPEKSTYKRRFQAKEPSPLVTPAKPPQRPARPPAKSTFKRRRLLKSDAEESLKRWRGAIPLVDQEGVVHYGGFDGSAEDLERKNFQGNSENCGFSSSTGVSPEVNCMATHDLNSHEQMDAKVHDGISNNEASHGISQEDCTQNFTPEACSVEMDKKNPNSRKHVRKPKYWPKINDRTKPKRVPKSKKRLKPGRNMHVSDMPPQTYHVTDQLVHGPQTPEPSDQRRSSAAEESVRKESITPGRSCRRAVSFSSLEEISTGNAFSFDSKAKDENAALLKSMSGNTLQGCNGFLASVMKGVEANQTVDERNLPFTTCFDKNLEVQDFETCVGMIKILRQFKRGKCKSRNGSMIVEDLKASLSQVSHVPKKCRTSRIRRGKEVKIPRRKRSKRNRPAKIQAAEVSNAEIDAVTSLDVTCIPVAAISSPKTENKKSELAASEFSKVEAEEVTSLDATSMQTSEISSPRFSEIKNKKYQLEDLDHFRGGSSEAELDFVENRNSANLALQPDNFSHMLNEYEFSFGFVPHNSVEIQSWYPCYDEAVSETYKYPQPLQPESLALENVAFNTMEHDCSIEMPMSQDFRELMLRCPKSSDDESRELAGLGSEVNNSMIPYTARFDAVQMQGSEANNVLIPYGGVLDSAQCWELVVQERESDNALIPHGERVDSAQRNKPRARIDMCSNTTRIWNLLMENDGSLDDVDDNTKEWLRDETEQLSDRIDVFISRMNLFQGDRRFSRWRGSVVDSVVGVYLTQNVTDNLSSSAFMSLAAKYPPKDPSAKDKDNAFNKRTVGTYASYQDPDTFENENVEEFIVPLSKSPYVDMKSSSPKSVPYSSGDSTKASCTGNASYSSSELPDLNLPPDLNLAFDLNLPYGSLVHEQSDVSDCRSSELADISDGGESSGREKGELMDISGDGGCASNESEPQVKNLDTKTKTNTYWYSIAKRIAIAQANRDGKKLKIASQKSEATSKLDTPLEKRKGKQVETQDDHVNWNELKSSHCTCKPRNHDSLDSVDWDAVRHAPLEEVAKVIEGRGMNNVLAGRIKDFLDRMVHDHGSIDLEWLRDIPPIKAKDYLKSIDGIGLKSVECVRLLALEHHAFPVDTNVGRIAVRLGWVPLQPLPDGILIHLLEKYPLVDKIQQYLWPRLQGLDQRKLYELHYHMITFGKVFCKKRRPNCNPCPMKGECRHFASAYASEKLQLPGPNKETHASDEGHNGYAAETPSVPLFLEGPPKEPNSEIASCEPIIELPGSPERQPSEALARDIEDLCSDTDDEIPTIVLNTEAFRQNLLMELEKRNCMRHDVSKALVTVTHEAASIRMQKRQEVRRLRTEHQVYELEDGHPLLAGFEEREPGDPCPYLVKIWTTGKTVKSGYTIEEQTVDTVPGTILIPCRTAIRGSFPLNGTYFQTNEMFADDESSRHPISVPTGLLWNKSRRKLYCGTSVASIFSVDVDLPKITHCFWRGFICVRGFDKATRAPRPLHHKFHRSPPKKKEDLDE